MRFFLIFVIFIDLPLEFFFWVDYDISFILLLGHIVQNRLHHSKWDTQKNMVQFWLKDFSLDKNFGQNLNMSVDVKPLSLTTC